MKEQPNPNDGSMDLLGLSISFDANANGGTTSPESTTTSTSMNVKKSALPVHVLDKTSNLQINYSTMMTTTTTTTTTPLTPIKKHVESVTPLDSPKKSPGMDPLPMNNNWASDPMKSLSPIQTVTPKHKPSVDNNNSNIIEESEEEHPMELPSSRTPTRAGQGEEATTPSLAKKRSSLTPPARFGRVLMSPWKQKKNHRRAFSLEVSALSMFNLGDDGDDKNKKNRSSVPNSPTGSPKLHPFQRSQQQMMTNQTLDQLQMPSLAKPSPTSFLMGNADEVVRSSELDPTPHQTEIPPLQEFVVAARLIEFVDSYRHVDQNFDLQQWAGRTRLDLIHQTPLVPEHQPILQSLLDCGDDVSPLGTVAVGTTADDRVEVMIFENQRQFIAIFRGTTEQQSKAGGMVKLSKKRNIKQTTIALDAEHGDAEVFSCFREEYQKLEKDCFALLDKLTEQNPFFDVAFAGYSFGAAMATLAAFRYSNARAMMRVSCLTLASPKVGMSVFNQLVNSSPNLKVMRLEYGQDAKCQTPNLGGLHVGHTLVLHSSLGQNDTSNNPSSKTLTSPVQAYKFETPKFKKFKTIHPELRNYISALEEMALLKLPWVKDFVGTSGKGVVVNNETRQVV